MKCQKCGNQWEISNGIISGIYVCPFCGETIGDDGRSKKNIGEIILGLRQSFGDDILENPSRLNSILMDFAPEMPKERKLIVNALKEGILAQFRRGIEGSKEEISIVVQRCVASLVSDMWITEAAAHYVMDVVLIASGFSANTAKKNIDSIASVSTSSLSFVESDSAITPERVLNKGSEDFGTFITEDELKTYTSIGYKAFASNVEIAKVDIPGNIRTIYPKAFSGCISLKEVNIKGTEVLTIGNCAFEGCDELSTITIRDNRNYGVINGMLIDKSKKKLMRCLHSGNKTVKIQYGVKTICRKAFEDPVTEIIHLPGTVDIIEEDAFFMTVHLAMFQVDGSNMSFRSIGGVLHSKDGKTLIKYPQGNLSISYYLEDMVERIDRKAFSHCDNLVTITFSSTLMEIGAQSFEYCSKLENIILPRSVVSIGERTFQYCDRLTSAMLPHGIQTIGEGAFLGCVKLKAISIPKSVENIGNMAFAGCKALSSVVIQENVKHIGEGAFIDCPQVKILIAGNAYVETYCRSHGIPYSKM